MRLVDRLQRPPVRTAVAVTWRPHGRGAVGCEREGEQSDQGHCERCERSVRVRGAAKKNSPSRWRFRPLSPLTVRFRVEPSGCASTYSRSVLGAIRNLRNGAEPVKSGEYPFAALCDLLAFAGDRESTTASGASDPAARNRRAQLGASSCRERRVDEQAIAPGVPELRATCRLGRAGAAWVP
jgi:hypothetical protein